MSIFAQAFQLGNGGAEGGGLDGEEVEQSVFGPAPVRMKLDKPVANRFILSAIRHAQAHNKVQFAKQAASEARAKRLANMAFVRGRPLKMPGEEDAGDEAEPWEEDGEDEAEAWEEEEEEEEEVKPPARQAARSTRGSRAKVAPTIVAAPPKQWQKKKAVATAPQRVAVITEAPGRGRKSSAKRGGGLARGRKAVSAPSPSHQTAETDDPMKLVVTASLDETKLVGAAASTTSSLLTKPVRVKRKTTAAAVAKRSSAKGTSPHQVLVRRSLRILMKQSPKEARSRLASLIQVPAMWTEHGRQRRAEKREELGKKHRHKQVDGLRATALQPKPVPLAVPGLPSNWVCNLIIPAFLCPPGTLFSTST